MKNLYLLAFSLLGISQINAQITLTQSSNEPVIGETYDMKDIDTTVVLPMSISGSNVTWNVTGVTETGGFITNNFIDPTTDPNASSFPGTTLVQSDGNSNTYFKSSTNLTELLGLDASGSFQLNYNTNPLTIAAYPITMGYTNNDTGAGAVTANTLTGTFTSTIQTTADGTGTLNFNGLSSANYMNCLRVKSAQKVNFSLAGGFVSGTMDMVIYNYYVSAFKFPVFTVNYMHISAPTVGIDQVQNQASILSNVVLGLSDRNVNDITFKAYPNPAKNQVSLHFVLTSKDSYSIDILNALGQVVRSVAKPDLQPGLYNEAIDLNGLSAGIYHIRVKGSNATGVEKLIVE